MIAKMQLAGYLSLLVVLVLYHIDCCMSSSCGEEEDGPELPPVCLGQLARQQLLASEAGEGSTFCNPGKFIEIEFTLRFGCDIPTHIDQGVRFEVDPGGTIDGDWEAIRFYTPTLTPAPPQEGEATRVTLEEGGRSVYAVAGSYNSSLPLLHFNSSVGVSEGVVIREYLCQDYVEQIESDRADGRFRLRWMQRYLTDPQADVATWSLDNLRIRVWNGNCFTSVLSENFDDTTLKPPTDTIKVASMRGSVTNLPCSMNDSVLYFNEDFVQDTDTRRSLLVTFESYMLEGSCSTPEKTCVDGAAVVGDSCPLKSEPRDVTRITCSRGRVSCQCTGSHQTGNGTCAEPATTSDAMVTTPEVLTTMATTTAEASTGTMTMEETTLNISTMTTTTTGVTITTGKTASEVFTEETTSPEVTITPEEPVSEVSTMAATAPEVTITTEKTTLDVSTMDTTSTEVAITTEKTMPESSTMTTTTTEATGTIPGVSTMTTTTTEATIPEVSTMTTTTAKITTETTTEEATTDATAETTATTGGITQETTSDTTMMSETTTDVTTTVMASETSVMATTLATVRTDEVSASVAMTTNFETTTEAMTTEKVTMTSSTTPASDTSTTSVTPETPSNATATPKTPTATPEAPSNATATPKTPTTTPEAPSNATATPKTPTATPEAPSNATATPKTPTTTPEAPSNATATPKTPTATPEAPSNATATPKTPAATPEAPSNATATPETPTTTPEAPSNATATPETPSNTAATPKTPSSTAATPETPFNATTTPEIPSATLETPSSTAATPKTPSNATANPETPSNATATPETPSNTAATPKTPSSTAATPETPFNATTTSEIPSNTVATLDTPSSTAATPKTPSNATATPETPSNATATPETPSNTAATSETPSNTAVTPETPSNTAATPETPSNTATTPDTPSNSTITPQSPSDATMTPVEVDTTSDAMTTATTVAETSTVAMVTTKHTAPTSTTAMPTTTATTTMEESSTGGSPALPSSSMPEATPTTARITSPPPVFGCPAETDVFGLPWKLTKAGTEVTLPCGQGSATRLCNKNCTWHAPDVRDCLKKPFKELELPNDVSTFDPAEAERLLRNIEGLVEDTAVREGVSLFPQELETTARFLQVTVRYLFGGVEDLSLDNKSESILTVISNLVSLNNLPGFRQLLEILPSSTFSESLLGTAEEYGLFLSTLLEQDNASTNITLIRDHILINAQSILVGEILGDLIFPTTDYSSTDARIIVPATVLKERADIRGTGRVRVANMLFENIEHFLPTDLNQIEQIPVTLVLSSQVEEPGTVKNLTRPVTITFNTTAIEDSGKDFSCVFFDFNTTQFSTEGVETNVVSVRGDDATVNCTSNHLTSFAVLVNVAGVDMTAESNRALQAVSYVGLGISLACLLATIIFFLTFGKELFTKKIHNFVHLNLATSLFLAYLVFTVGVELAARNEALCQAVTAVLHYLFLAVFCWMLSEGVMLYLMLVVVFTKLAKKWWFFFLLGWLPPLPFVGIGLATVRDQYGVRVNGTLEYCWLSSGGGQYAIWTFVAPMLAIIVINVVFLVLVLNSLVKSQRKKNRRKKRAAKEGTRIDLVKSTVKSAIILLPLLGLTWVFGLLAVNRNTLVFAWIFTILNTLQGLFIFVLHVLRHERIWKRVRRYYGLPTSTISRSAYSNSSQRTNSTYAASAPNTLLRTAAIASSVNTLGSKSKLESSMASEDTKFLPSGTPDMDRESLPEEKDSLPEEKDLEIDGLKLPLNDVDSADEGLGGELTEDFQIEMEAFTSVPDGEDGTRDRKSESGDLNSNSSVSGGGKTVERMECSSSAELTNDEQLMNETFIDRKLTKVESAVIMTATEEVRIEMEAVPDEVELAELPTKREVRLEIEEVSSTSEVPRVRELASKSPHRHEDSAMLSVNFDTIATYELKICLEEGESEEEEIPRGCALRKKESFSIALPGARGRLPSDEIEGISLYDENPEGIFEGDDIELEVVYPIDRTST